MKKYQIIGGQYESIWYGESDSLLGAKQIASRHVEAWDNYQSWNTPKIYLSEHTEEVESRGRILTRDGERIVVPTGAPYLIKDNGQWTLTYFYWKRENENETVR